MSYQVYARKYRPHQFDDVVGQQSVITTLINSLKRDRIAHAYIFTGMRGVGKTTTARIFSKALNCEEGVSVTPCDKCSSCREIDLGISTNVKEIDGATYTKVENIRELKDDADFVPSGANYKIYIIDEVHMLSKSAFNALLKIIEEPPPRVKFIFATTELNKIPKTIVSRCQVYNFKKVPQSVIIETLRKIAIAEDLQIGDESLMEIARVSDGSLRDAERNFDQIISFCGEQPTDREVKDFLGVADKSLLSAFITSIKDKEYESIIHLYHSEVLPNMECMTFLESLLEYIKDLTVVNCLKDKSNNILNYSDMNLELLKKTAQRFGNIELEYLFSIFSRTIVDARNSPHPEMLVEMMLIKAADMQVFHALPEIVDKLKEAGGYTFQTASPPQAQQPMQQRAPQQQDMPLSQQQAPYQQQPAPQRPQSAPRMSADTVGFGNRAPATAPQQAPMPQQAPVQQQSVQSAPAVTVREVPSEIPSTATNDNAASKWEMIVKRASEIRGSLVNVLQDWELVREDGNALTLRCRKGNGFIQRRLTENDENLGALKRACIDILQHPVHINFDTTQPQEPQRPINPIEEERPSEQEVKKKTFDPERKPDPHQTELVLKAIEKFDGRVIR